MAAALPPMVSGGLPVVGHIFEMLKDRERLFKRGFAEHGNAFAMRLANQNVLVITGSEHNKLMYTQTDKTLNMQEGYGFLKEAVGEVLFTASKDDYYNQRPALQEVFKRERMVGYIQAMNIEVQRWLDSLGQSGEIDITEAMLHLAQYVAGRALIGENFREELNDEFWQDYLLISQSLDPVLPPTLPLPKFKRRDRARVKISAVLKGLIDKRRANPDQYNDLISALLTTPLKDGSIMPDDTIVAMFMGLIFAGHETTAGQAAWLVALLLQHPDYLDQVRHEVQEHVHYGQPVDASVLSKLEKTYWAIDETTRMRPSADTQIRTVTEAVMVGDYLIPAGWRMMVSGATSHFLPEQFNNPESFDPERFSPERGEGKDPFAIIGFGGGIHKCTGMNFAKNEMAIIVSLFFKQFDTELLSDEIHTVSGNGANRPSAVRVRYQRKPLTQLTDAATIAEAAAAGCPHIKQHLATES
ncbi:MAG: cytochrome P450 [Chloroflexota bacterium]